ncbi:MAG: hypothetical protein QXS19_07355, partial [Candidatus Methanomethylicia archaeon]
MYQERDDSIVSLNYHYRIDDVYTNNLYKDVLFAYSIDQRTPDYYFVFKNSYHGYLVKSNRIRMYTRFLVVIDCDNESVTYICSMYRDKVLEFDVVSYVRDWTSYTHIHSYIRSMQSYDATTAYNYHTKFGVITSFLDGDIIFYIMPVVSSYEIRLKVYIVYTDEDLDRKDLFVAVNIPIYGIKEFIYETQEYSFINSDFHRFYLNKLNVYTVKSVIYFPLAKTFFSANDDIKHIKLNNVILYRYRDKFSDVTSDFDIGYVYPNHAVIEDTLLSIKQLSPYDSFLSETIDDLYLIYSFHYLETQKDFVREFTLLPVDLDRKPTYLITFKKINSSFDSYSDLHAFSSNPNFNVQSY